MNEEFAKLGVELDVSLHIRLFGLVFGRLIGFALPTPFLGGKLVPGRIKFGIPLFFAAFFYPFLRGAVDPNTVPDVGFVYFGVLAKEIFIGYALGFLVSLPFHALDSAGSFMDTQRGTTFAQVISPMSGGQASLLGQFTNLMFLTIFLSMGGLGIALDGIAESYAVFPILSAPPVLHPNAPAALEFIARTQAVFEIAVQFAAPVVITMFLTDATLGIVNRTAPNIQVFFLGMPIKALGGLVVFFLVLDFVHEVFVGLLTDLAVHIRTLLQAMAAS